MEVSTHTLDALCKGSAIEIETLTKMRDGSASLFDGMIAESQKRKIALEEVKEATSALRKDISDSSSATIELIRTTGQWITSEMITCRRDAEASCNRYTTAVEDAKALYERNTANANMLIDAGYVFKRSSDLLNEVLMYMNVASTSQKWRADTMAKMNEISNGQERLERTCMDIPGGRIEDEVRDAAITQAEAKYKKEMTDLNARWKDLNSMSKMFLTRLENLTTNSS